MIQIIGIDPDIDKSGVCIIVHNKVELFNFNMPTLFNTFFKNLQAQQESNFTLKTEVYVEAGFLNNHYFQPLKSSTFVIAKINRNIGENHACAKIIIEMGKAFNLNIIPCYPVTSTNYRSRGKKITHPQFLQMLQRNNLNYYGESSNQESRDAALLAVTYGLNKEYHESNNILNNRNAKSINFENKSFCTD